MTTKQLMILIQIIKGDYDESNSKDRKDLDWLKERGYIRLNFKDEVVATRKAEKAVHAILTILDL